eukprot:scaffold51366_cov52-Phaeocystis_antarctica.AAC.3
MSAPRQPLRCNTHPLTSAGCEANGPDHERPALATRSSTLCASGAVAACSASADSGRARSSATTCVSAPCSCSRVAARSASAAARRATSTTLQPRLAASVARAWPMPLDAPVMTAHGRSEREAWMIAWSERLGEPWARGRGERERRLFAAMWRDGI